MHVLVLGGGVIGTTTAYYLAKQGVSVSVIERQSDVAEETSFGNAGQISPGYSTPWAAPDVPLKVVKWLFKKHAPLAIRADGSLWQLQWMGQMLANCNAASYAINKARMMRVAEYSRDCLRALRTETGIAYEHRALGTLQLFRSQAQLDTVGRDIRLLDELGVDYQFFDSGAVLATVEPALAHATGLTGGLHLPNDETGDCNLFTKRLSNIARELGVNFHFGRTIKALHCDNHQLLGVQVDDELLTADHYVLACGSHSRALAVELSRQLDHTLGKALGKFPVYPVKGYSLTIPIIDETRAPISTVLDETYKVAITRFDKRIRVGGMAELAGFDLSLRQNRRETLEMVVDSLFSGGDLSAAKFWTGLRPMTPDGTPIIGRTRLDNLWVNTGHGTLGWTMACGSGALLSDLITQRTPAIDIEGLSLERYA